MSPLNFAEGLARDIGKRLTDPPDARFIVSYPKAGITWLRYMLAQLIASSYAVEASGETVDLEEFTTANTGVPSIIDSHDHSEIAIESPRRINPNILFSYTKRIRYKRRNVLFLIRDPRDMVVSYYHQATKRSYHPVAVNDLTHFIRHPVYGMPRIIRFYDIWASNLHALSAYRVLRYEDLQTKGASELYEAAEFLGIDTSTAHAERVYANSTAEKMRHREIRGEISGMRLTRTEPNFLKVRRAKVHGYLEEMTEADQDYCNMLIKAIKPPFRYSV